MIYDVPKLKIDFRKKVMAAPKKEMDPGPDSHITFSSLYRDDAPKERGYQFN
jgi:hypothetical protein